jgi:hypothetical protein
MKTDVNIAATSSSSVKSKYKNTAKVAATIQITAARNLLIKTTKNGNSSMIYFSKL